MEKPWNIPWKIRGKSMENPWIIKTEKRKCFRGTPWVPMGAHGDPWAPMRNHGFPWGRPHGSPWVPMGSHGFPWGPHGVPMGSHGSPWGHMGPHEESWVPMGPHGSPWVPMGSHGSHGSPWVPTHRFAFDLQPICYLMYAAIDIAIAHGGPGPMGPKGGPMGAKEREPKKGTIFIDGPSMNSLMETLIFIGGNPSIFIDGVQQ